MCVSRLAPYPTGLMHHLSVTTPNPLFSSPELARMPRAGETKLNAPSSPSRSWRQYVRTLPLSPPPLLLLTLGIRLK